MINVQIIFLYTSFNKLSAEERERIKKIVIEEYCKEFSVTENDISVIIQDAYAENMTDDICLAINSPNRVINEAVKNNAVKDAVATRLSLLKFMKQSGFSGKIGIHVGEVGGVKNNDSANTKSKSKNNDNESQNQKILADDYTERAKMYQAEEPRYTFEMLKIPKDTLLQIEQAIGRIQYEQDVFEKWGLYTIMPSPISAMSFYGPPGTGKSLAADAIASKLNKKIIRASYADIENKYVGEGPKNVGAIFLAAEQQDAILFIDEADSLLSKRLVNVSDPSGQAMNSMRSQLLISLEKFHGIVIFATNLVVNYDRAFVSRLINIKFDIPDAEMRKEIWQAHLYPRQSGKYNLNIPLSDDIDLDVISGKYEMCGRDIRNAVVNACVNARMEGLDTVTQECLCAAAEKIQKSQNDAVQAEDHTKVNTKSDELTKEQKEALAGLMNKKIREQRNEEVKSNEAE